MIKLFILKRQIYSLFPFLFLFGMLGSGFAQSVEADVWYQQLDSFLEKPTINNLDKLEKDIDALQTSSKDSQLAQVITLCNVGYYNQQFNRLTRSILYYEKAKSIYFNESLSGYDIIEYCLKPLGNLYTQTNAFSEAENTIKHYLLLAQKEQNIRQEVSALLNLSIVYKSVGQYDKALRLLYQAQKFNPDHPLIFLQLAENYIKKEEYSRAEAFLKKTENLYPAFSKTYLLQADIAVQKKQFYNAENYYQKALSLQKQNPKIAQRELAKTYLSLAKVQVEKKDLSSATENITKTYQLIIPGFDNNQHIPEKTQLYAENTLLDALDVQAWLLSLQKQPEASLLCYELANEVSLLLLSQATLRQSKINPQTQRKNRFERMLTLVYGQYQTTKEIRWLQKALSIDAESKSFVVNENHRLLNRLKNHRSDSLVRQYFSVSTQLEHVKNRLETLQETHLTQPDSLLSWQKNYSGLVTQQRNILRQIQDKYPVSSSVAGEFSLDKLQEKLRESSQTIVSYFFGSNEVFQWIVDGEKVTFNRLISGKKERDNLFEQCVKMNNFFTDGTQINNRQQEYFALAHTLFNTLHLPEKERIILIPDGILSFIPFDALVTHTTASVKYETVPFLVKQTQISYCLSLRDIVQHKDNTIAEGTSILGVFPEFKDSEKELTYSIQEAEAIDKSFDSMILKGEKATSKAFLKNLSAFDVIHLSTHARGGTFNSPPVIELIDRVISVNELYGLQLDNLLVVLSACETGVGKLIKGEGVINLARGFRYAGAENVLFTLWNVNDYATARIMQNFYGHVSKNMTTTQALTASKKDYLKDDTVDNTKKSPFYWASFVYYGEPVVIKPETLNFYFVLLIVLLGLMASVILLIKRDD